MWTFSVPLFVQVSKSKRFYLNLNGYRNEHYQTLNKAKVMYAAIVKPLIGHVPRNLRRIHISYTLFPKTRVELDTANILCIVDKFVCDTLVANGVLEDDNFKFVITTRHAYGHVDPQNPRAEVTITLDQPDEEDTTIEPPVPEEEDMKISINEVEIKAAITAMILGQINVKPGHKIEIDLRATRGAEGFMADIDITPEDIGGTATAAAPTADPEPAAAGLGIATRVETARKAPTPEPTPAEPAGETVNDPAAAEASTAEATEAAPARGSLFAS